MDSSIEHQRTVRFMVGTLTDEVIERWHQSKLHCRDMVTPKPVNMLQKVRPCVKCYCGTRTVSMFDLQQCFTTCFARQ